MSIAQNPTTEEQINALWHPELIRKYDLAGPRYTSYPTANQFTPDIGEQQWRDAIAKGNQTLTPLSLYFHIPFCDTVCYYCACNKIITANKKVASPYIEHLLQEITLQASHIDSQRKVKQLHWGGGTPTYLSDAQMAEVMQHVAKTFDIQDKEAEISIEVHPAGVNPQRIKQLRQLGFNRISMGIQDFDPAVQRAVNRFNSYAEVDRLMACIREEGFNGISLDLIYGLPKQSAQSFAKTLEHVIALSPDRLSIFNYAHMPHLFKTQKQINSWDLPEPQEKLEILHNSINALLDAGYVYIGMDHFAKPDDELAIAQQEGLLHRNFQGYATHAHCDLLGFGVTSISAIGDVYIQNHKNMADYTKAIENSSLPFTRGVQLNQDDSIRRAVINQLMCNFHLDFEAIEKVFNIQFQHYFARELNNLKSMKTDGLLSLDNNHLEIQPAGRLLIRSICMVFDSYIPAPEAQQHARFSRII